MLVQHALQSGPLCGARPAYFRRRKPPVSEAHARAEPDQPSFWRQVSASLPGRSEQECSEQFYLQHPTPSRKRRRGPARSWRSVTRSGDA